MTRLPLLLLGVALLAGCNSADSTPIKTAAPLNPSGKPRNEQEAVVQAGQTQAGQNANARMAAAAKAMADARAKAGGH